MPGLRQVEHWDIRVHILDLRSRLARIGCRSSVALCGAYIEDDDDDVGDTGKIGEGRVRVI